MASFRDELKRLIHRWRNDRTVAVLVAIVEVHEGPQPVIVNYVGPVGLDLEIAEAMVRMLEDRNAGKAQVQ